MKNNINFFDDSKLRPQFGSVKEYIFIRKIGAPVYGHVICKYDLPDDVVKEMIKHAEAYEEVL